MTKTISQQAQVASIIRKEIKARGLIGTVKASQAAGTTSVSVILQDACPKDLAELEQFTKPYKYGHFDGMTDSYEYSNSRDDIPQVRFLRVSAKFSDEIKQKALNAITAHFDLDAITLNDYPIRPITCLESLDMNVNIHRTLNGCARPYVPFWTDAQMVA